MGMKDYLELFMKAETIEELVKMAFEEAGMKALTKKEAGDIRKALIGVLLAKEWRIEEE